MVYATLKTIFWIQEVSVELKATCKSMRIRIKALTKSTWKPGLCSLLLSPLTTRGKEAERREGASSDHISLT